MFKKKQLKADKLDLDGELDFGDFNFDEIDGSLSSEARNKKSRSPVIDTFKGTVKGATRTFKSPSFIGGIVKKALPDTYGEVIDHANTIAGSVSSLYDDAIKGIKPQLSKLATKVDKLVPQESKILKKLTSNFKNIVGEEYKNNSPSKEQLQDQSIATTIGAIFEQQTAREDQIKAHQSAESKVKDTIETKRFENNFGLLNSINNNVSRLASYTEKVTQAWQKKSLELQYRSYFVQTELLDTNKKFYEIFKNQYDSIAKNTALPEYVKITNSEKFKELAKNKFYGSLQSSLFGDKDIVKVAMERLKKQVSQMVAKAKSGLEQGLAGVEMAESIKEQQESMGGMGGEQESGYGFAGDVLGANLAQNLGNKIGKWGKSKINDKSKVAKVGYKIAGSLANMPGLLKDAKNSKFMQNNLYSGGMKGGLAGLLAAGLDLFKAQGPDLKVGKANKLDEINNPSVSGFTNKSQKSLTEVIPGYLARIHREIMVLGAGDKKAGAKIPLTVYDFGADKFVSKKELSADIKASLISKVKSSSFGNSLDKAHKDLLGSTKTTDEQAKKIKEFMSELSNKDMKYTPEDIMKTDLFKSLDKDTANIISSALEDKISLSQESEKGQHDLNKSLKDIRHSTTDIRGEIELFIKAGYGEILEEQGIVTRAKDGSFDIDFKAYKKFVHEHTLVKSDKNAKKGISKLNPKKALAAIKKTKIYNWLYKSGQGDKKPHTGPMAQDVNQHMGEEAAPNGTSIDLTTMNGVNMSAIQALQKQQQELLKDDKSISTLTTIQKDIEKLVKLIEEGKGSFGGVGGTGSPSTSKGPKNYTDIFSSIASNTIGLISKVGGDLFSTANKGFQFGKDKIAKPFAAFIGKAFTNNKDKVGNAFKSLLGKAGDLAGKTLGVVQDIITNKIPTGYKQLVKGGKFITSKITELINGPMDIYVKGLKVPLLRANLIKVGHYIDQSTGKVIKSISDIKGPVVNLLGEVVLTAEDVANGLMDKDGKEIVAPFTKILKAALTYGAKGIVRVKDAAKYGIEKLRSAGKYISGKFTKNKVEDADPAVKGSKKITSTNFNDKIYRVLVQIRDSLKKPGRNRPAYNDKDGDGKRDGNWSDRIKELANRAKNRAKGVLDNDLTPRYKGASNVIDSMIDKGKGLLENKDNLSIKDRATNALEEIKESKTGKRAKELADKAKDKFNDKTKSIRESKAGKRVKGWKDKFGNTRLGKAGNGLFGRLGTIGSSIRSGLGTAGSAAMGVLGTKTGVGITADQTKAVEGSGHVEIDEHAGDHAKPTIKERSGNATDQLKQYATRKLANKKDTLQADLAPKYKSDKNVLDGMFDKAKGLFGTITEGVSGMFGKTSGVLDAVSDVAGLGGGKKGLLGKLGSGLKSVIKSPFKAIGAASKGLAAIKPLVSGISALKDISSIARVASAANMIRNGMMVGSLLTGGTGAAIFGSIATGLSTLGAVLASPVVLGAVAIAAVGYGAYKAYKYVTKDNTNEYEDIRIKQYGLTNSGSDKSKNHFILQLENYLLDGIISYDNGVARLNPKKLNVEEMLSIFSIDKGDTDGIDKFKKWFNDRFKPFFLTHATALFSINSKVKLDKVPNLKIEERMKYLGKCFTSIEDNRSGRKIAEI